VFIVEGLLSIEELSFYIVGDLKELVGYEWVCIGQQ
jgi:hypothetical protein